MSLTRESIDWLTSPGERLPRLTEWLLSDVWSERAYRDLGPATYLRQGEQKVNALEEVIAAAAWRVYDEFLSSPPADRDVAAFLRDQRPCAVVVYDGLSLREVPPLLELARRAGLQVLEVGVSVAALPSETIDFVEQRVGAGKAAPSQLPRRRELEERGIAAYYYNSPMDQNRLDENVEALLLWSAFPDNTYADSGARFPNHFEVIHKMLETAWLNTVMTIRPGRKILVTSDHGYVYFGPGMSFLRSNEQIRPLTAFLGGERHRRLDGSAEPPEHPDLKVLPDRQLAIVQGRVQTHPPGPAAAKLYKHGGLSPMEMLTPWIVLESRA
ncbi:MAG: hypothetical protein ACUVV3_03520 [Dehalococcoidia bacterium]